MLLYKSKKLLIAVLTLAALLCTSTSAFAAVPKYFKSLTGTGVVHGILPGGDLPGNFSLSLNNLRNDSETGDLVANLNFTYKYLYEYNEDQQGNEYEKVYLVVKIKDAKALIDSTNITPGISVNPENLTTFTGSASASVSLVGDGKIIYSYGDNIPVDFTITDGKAALDQLQMYITDVLYISGQDLPNKTIVTNYASGGQNQQ
jgi:hypothetical protein